MGYSLDFRKRTIEYLEEGHTFVETSKTFKVSVGTIVNWKKLLEETGSLEKRELNRTFKKIDPERLKEYVRDNPDAYQNEMAEEFGCTPSAICRALKRLKITLKKRPYDIRNKIQKR